MTNVPNVRYLQETPVVLRLSPVLLIATAVLDPAAISFSLIVLAGHPAEPDCVRPSLRAHGPEDSPGIL